MASSSTRSGCTVISTSPMGSAFRSSSRTAHRVVNSSGSPERKMAHAGHPPHGHTAHGHRLVRPHQQVQVAPCRPRASTARRTARARAPASCRRSPRRVRSIQPATASRRSTCSGGSEPSPLGLTLSRRLPPRPATSHSVCTSVAARLVAGVVRVVAPAVVHRHAGLPRPVGRLRRHELLGRLVVADAGQAVVDEDVRLQLADQRLELGGPPLVRRPLPAAVEPEHVDLPVARSAARAT